MTKEDRELITARLLKARQDSNMSQEILGSHLGCRNSKISRFEKGKGLANKLLEFKQFCEITKSDPNWILGFTDENVF